MLHFLERCTQHPRHREPKIASDAAATNDQCSLHFLGEAVLDREPARTFLPVCRHAAAHAARI
jgi:hypothetical protein